MKNSIAFYFAIFLSRIHWFILIFVVVATASITISRLLPAVYVSNTQLLIESSQIPTQLAAPTIQVNPIEELQVIEKRLMTRINLLDIARSENVFAGIDEMSADVIVEQMRQQTEIQRSAGHGQATLMAISFKAVNGVVAASVVNRYVTIILQDNAEIRTNRAGKTLEFFEIEVDRLGNELGKQSAAIIEFNNNNSDALPSTLAFRFSQQTTLLTRQATLVRDIDTLGEQKRRLMEIFETTGGVGASPLQNMTPDQIQLAELEVQLTNAMALYSVEHPKVRMLKAQVSQQQVVVRSQAGVVAETSNPPSSILDVQLAEIESRIAVFNEQLTQVREQLAGVESSIERTPKVQIQLDALARDYQNTQQQYNAAVNGLAQSAQGERIELLAKGRRIAIIDPATVPSEPDSPNRMLIAIGGSALGAFLGLAFIADLESLNSSIRRAADITRGIGITPIVTVPYIRTPMELVVRRAAFVAAFAVLIIGIPAALFALHTYYMPLDLIYDRFATKIGTLL
ncbi:MAG: lipopolysaccharide biosynthesis protein [Marinosulfonomonas sp.]|nr:lipopolysaccharide biosynthesis protein [Marinosulfonomonas sp.]